MLTLETVVPDLYRAILGRDPESEAVIASHVGRGSVQAVASALLESDERKRAGTSFSLHRCFDFSVFVPNDDWMYDGLIKFGTYEPYVAEPFRDACRGRRVLDVGANIGVFSMIAAKVSAQTVTAVEISAINAKLVALNADYNKFRNVEIFPVGASDRMGPIRSVGANSNKTVSYASIDPANFNDVDVAFSVPLDLIVRDKIDVLKIDVEGHEYNALRGAKDILDGKPMAFIEFSPDFMRDVSGVEPAQVMEIFWSRGYEATILHRDMTREKVGQDIPRLIGAWQDYMDRCVTHIDLMLTAAH